MQFTEFDRLEAIDLSGASLGFAEILALRRLVRDGNVKSWEFRDCNR